MNKFLLFLPFFLLTLSCDDGKIYPDTPSSESGKSVQMEVSFKKLDVWPINYQLAFVVLDAQTGQPTLSKLIRKPSSEESPVTVRLNNLKENQNLFAIAVINKSQQLIYSYYQYEMKSDEQDMVLPVKEINLLSFDRIQKNIFNTYCIACHGGAESAAGGLYLTDEKSRTALVNVPSVCSPEKKLLVSPGNPSQSFLTDILTTDRPTIVHHNHTLELPEDELLTLLNTWIEEGASE